MAGRKKLGLFLLLLLAILIVASGWLVIKLWLPVHPQQSYFSTTEERIPQVHWLLNRFQPVFLYPFSRGGSGFLRVAYRDAKGHIRFMDIYVSRPEENPSLLGVAGNPITKVFGYWRYLRLGQRLNLTYLRTVTPQPGTGAADAAPPSTDVGQRACAYFSTFCYSARLTEANPDPYWNFPTTGRFPTGILFPAVNISTELVD